jgi:hypothetical protein
MTWRRGDMYLPGMSASSGFGSAGLAVGLGLRDASAQPT